MAQVGTGYLRGQQTSKPATAEGRALSRDQQSNPQVAQPGDTAAVPHDSSSGIDKANRSATRLTPSNHGGLTPITQGPPSAKPPQPAK